MATPSDCESGKVPPPFRWDVDRCLRLRTKLDALYFHLYRVTDRDDIRHVLHDVVKLSIAILNEYLMWLFFERCSICNYDQIRCVLKTMLFFVFHSRQK